MVATVRRKREVPASLTALGRREPPRQIPVGGKCYLCRQIFKNDFFALTALYADGDDRVILKIHRQAPFLLFPLGWVGRWLAARECACLRRLEDVHGVPRLIGRWGKTGVVREYIEGHPMARRERVREDFHPRLRALIETIHARGMAYVDLEKCENVIVGDDGCPYLVDFQIAWCLPRRLGGELWPVRVVRAWLQRGDLYHLTKLQRRTRPDQLSLEALQASYRRPWYIRLYRAVSWPLLLLRRLILRRIDPRRVPGERGRVGEHNEPFTRGVKTTAGTEGQSAWPTVK